MSILHRTTYQHAYRNHSVKYSNIKNCTTSLVQCKAKIQAVLSTEYQHYKFNKKSSNSHANSSYNIYKYIYIYINYTTSFHKLKINWVIYISTILLTCIMSRSLSRGRWQVTLSKAVICLSLSLLEYLWPSTILQTYIQQTKLT
jgi:ABC-type thiamin/hydroxymethylpyrimidine transport system permease subunit